MNTAASFNTTEPHKTWAEYMVWFEAN